jgi:hypothetical protein
MIRTKHLFVGGALLVTVISTGGMGVLVQRMSVPDVLQPASVILGTPDDQYAAAVDTGFMEDTVSFVERIRDSYVPPSTMVDEVDATPEPQNTEYVPVPEPETPTSEPLPIATIEEEVVIDTGTTTTSEVSASSTMPETHDDAGDESGI